MKNNLLYLAAFIAGGAVATLATREYFKTKYQKLAQAEIISVKEIYSKKRIEHDNGVIQTGPHPEPFKPSSDVLVNKIDDLAEKYNSLSSMYHKESKKEVDEVEKPYVISPDEFGEMDGYLTVSLTYYEDEVLAYDDDELVDDIDGTVGSDAFSHFGEYEDDSVFVRNDALKCDYEILRDYRNYSDVAK